MWFTCNIIWEHLECDSHYSFFLFQVNHSFRHTNSAYVSAEHPRWGSIMCVESQRPIKAGEELYTYYGYGQAEPPNDFPCYFDLKKKIDEEEKEKKRQEEEAKKNKKKKKSSKKTTNKLF